jgi:hypothetical protein
VPLFIFCTSCRCSQPWASRRSAPPCTAPRKKKRSRSSGTSPISILKVSSASLHTRFAARKGLAKAINHLAVEVDADLIVLKTHGRRGFSHLILGSVAEEVVRSAPCAVLTLTPTAQHRVAHHL